MNLTQAAQYTKRIIIFSIIFLFLIIIGVIGYNIWKSYYLANQPKPIIKPEQKYGELPTIKFPATKAQPANLSYSIDTTTGELPTFDKFIKVYFIPRPVVTLLAADRSNQLAAKLGIQNTPVSNSDSSQYTYNQENKSLTVHLDSSNFIFANFASPSANFNFNGTELGLVAGFKNVLSSLGIMRPDLDLGPFKVQYFQFGIPPTPVTALKEANTARVSLWPGKIDDKPILTADPNVSLVNGLFFTTPNELKNYLEINYTYWAIDSSDFSNYYLKTASEAFDNLKAGEGVVIQPPVSNNVSITNVTLAYYLPSDYAPYLQPIYVFSGPSFIAYVPAVGSEPVSTP
jgi:hypothetical protein